MKTIDRKQGMIDKALECIRGHYNDEALDVESLAQYCGCSRRVLERIFRAAFDRSPHETVLRHRVCIAKRFLLASNHSVEMIAIEVGFADVKSLRHHFKKVMGELPGEWRRRKKSQTSLGSEARTLL